MDKKLVNTTTVQWFSVDVSHKRTCVPERAEIGEILPILHTSYLLLFTEFPKVPYTMLQHSVLKSTLNKKDLNDVTSAPFSVCFFCCWQLRKRH
jgi:hypothetical protein